jgi:hypothetical protein
MTTRRLEVCPDNDLVVGVGPLMTVTAGVETAITSGVTGFLTGDYTDTSAPYGTWGLSLTHIGGANGFASGMFEYQLDASEITVARCEAENMHTQGYGFLVVKKDNAVWMVVRIPYSRIRWVEVDND